MKEGKIATFEAHMDDLIALHDKIKSHSFRKEFYKQHNIGTFKSLFKEYMSLIYDTTRVMINLAYYCKETSFITKDDCFWIHDFRNWLFVLDIIYVDTDRDWLDTKDVKGLGITPREVYAKTHITDINAVMIFLDKYIGYIHRFIETRQFNRIAGIYYECSTNPHNGYYYKHMVEYEKTDSGWKLIEEPALIGTKQIK